jgi:DNA-binding LytR/AlgR family response regulator
MSSPTAVIAEDEPLLRAELRETLAKLWPELEIRAEASTGFEALRAISEFNPRVLFLDIQMPGLTGLEVAKNLPRDTHVVFITAHDGHAVEAFEKGAIDYVPKPVSAARLSMTIDRIKQRLASAQPELRDVAELLRGLSGERQEYVKWLSVPHAGNVCLVMTDDICFLQADNKYTTVATAKSQFLLSSTLRVVKERLDPQTFWQIHRSTVVNVGAIRSVSRSFRGSLEVTLKERAEVLPVSAPYAHLFKHL